MHLNQGFLFLQVLAIIISLRSVICGGEGEFEVSFI